jgi:hypothetical protein
MYITTAEIASVTTTSLLISHYPNNLHMFQRAPKRCQPEKEAGSQRQGRGKGLGSVQPTIALACRDSAKCGAILGCAKPSQFLNGENGKYDVPILQRCLFQSHRDVAMPAQAKGLVQVAAQSPQAQRDGPHECEVLRSFVVNANERHQCGGRDLPPFRATRHCRARPCSTE